MIQQRTIPRQANFSSLNPKIPPLEPDSMAIAMKSRIWDEHRLTALVNNYGAAGSNAALIVQEYVDPKPVSSAKDSIGLPDSNPQECPVIISAHSTKALGAYCEALIPRLSQLQAANVGGKLGNIAYNLSRLHNPRLDHCWSCTASDTADLTDKLQRYGEEHDIKERKTIRTPVVLCFAGQAGQQAWISERLFNSCTLLRENLVSPWSCMPETYNDSRNAPTH